MSQLGSMSYFVKNVSTLSLLSWSSGVVNAAQVTDLSLEQAFACATTVPARLLGLQHGFAAPKKGARANLIVFELDEEKRNRPHATIRGVFIHGERRV